MNLLKYEAEAELLAAKKRAQENAKAQVGREAYYNEQGKHYLDKEFEAAYIKDVPDSQFSVPNYDKELTNLGKRLIATDMNLGKMSKVRSDGSIEILTSTKDYNATKQQVNEYIVELTKNVFGDPGKAAADANEKRREFEELDLSNTDPEKVFNAKYVAGYKGTIVYREPITGGYAIFGKIHIGEDYFGEKNKAGFADTLNHEWGHLQQEKQLGQMKYIERIAIISLLNSIGKVADGDYFNQPWELWADKEGSVSRATHTPEAIAKAEQYKRESFVPLNTFYAFRGIPMNIPIVR